MRTGYNERLREVAKTSDKLVTATLADLAEIDTHGGTLPDDEKAAQLARRREWFSIHKARLQALFDQPRTDADGADLIYMAVYPIAEYWCSVRLVFQQGHPENNRVDITYAMATITGGALFLDEMVAFMALQDTDPNAVEWKRQTFIKEGSALHKAGLQIVRGSMIPGAPPDVQGHMDRIRRDHNMP